jgi:hypothetical protein
MVKKDYLYNQKKQQFIIMKKEIKKIGMLFLLLGMTTLLNAQSVSLSSPMLFGAPFDVVENNGESSASFTFVESSSVAISAKVLNLPNVTISVNMQYVALTSNDVDLISGSLLDYFDVSYNDGTNILLFEQNNEIPGDWYGTVSFPITVTENSDFTEVLNGFNANISALGSTVNADGNVSIYTYTSANNVAADIPEEFMDIAVFPIPADKLLHLNNVKTDILNVCMYDSKGSIVLEQRLENQDNTIDVEKLSDGIYYLRIYETANGVYRNVKIILN